MYEKPYRFSFKKARVRKHERIIKGFVPNPKAVKPAANLSDEGKSLRMVSSVGRVIFSEVVMNLKVVEWIESYEQIADLD